MCACGQPLIGTKFVHLPGCPSASEHEITYRCEHCGAASPDEFDLVHGICVDCLESAFDVPLGLLYIQRNPDELTRFFEWEDKISYRNHPARAQIDALLLKRLQDQLRLPIDCERKQAAKALREYCLNDLEEWAEFIEREGVF